MRPTSLLFAFACLLFSTLHAQTNTAYLNRVANARFVMVTTERGDPFDPRTDSEDRRAVGDIQSMITQWKAFTLVYRQDQADIVIAVRTAGRVRANTGVQVSNHKPAPGSTNPKDTSVSVSPILAADASSAKEDLLSVYDAHDYPTSTVLWRGQQHDGLASPNIPLFDQFKKEVEKASSARNKKP
jgi:hypothetical protein